MMHSIGYFGMVWGLVFGVTPAIAELDSFPANGGVGWPPMEVAIQEAPLWEPNTSISPEATVSPTLADYLLEAESNNPGLKAAYYKWQGSLEKVPQVSSLRDPMLTFTEYLEKNVETRTGAQDFQLGVMQLFPYPGKLSLRGQAAAQEARAIEQEFIKARLNLRQEVRDAYYEYYYLEQSIRITAENLELLKHFERVASARYEVARAGNQDVIKAQVELGELENELRTLEDFREPVQARLNAALNRPHTSLFPPPREIQLRETELESGPILEVAFQTNPDLRAIDARIQKQQTELELAKKDYFPDFNVGLNWINTNDRIDAAPPGNGDDVLLGSVQINLPVYRGRLAAGVRQAEQGVSEFRNRREDFENQLSVDLQTALYKLRDAQRQIDLYADILIPKAKQSVEVTQTAYSAEEAGFLDLIDAERILLNFQNSYYRSVANYGQALAAIEAKVGQSVVESNAPLLAIPKIETPIAESSTGAHLEESDSSKGAGPGAIAPEEKETLRE
ncbi:MAG: TolC family protein [Candidatus Omnitrophica bacterium]|nr:TolC family protein [Candidatus Omnitrophota bacterium]